MIQAQRPTLDSRHSLLCRKSQFALLYAITKDTFQFRRRRIYYVHRQIPSYNDVSQILILATL